MNGKQKLTTPVSIIVFIILLIAAIVTLNQEPTAPVSAPGDYLFCWWNVENLFDDINDGRGNVADKTYDSWYGYEREGVFLKVGKRTELPTKLNKHLQLKLGKLTEAILKMNKGRGPDILAVGEVESIRAAELLKTSLNAQFDEEKEFLKYKDLAMVEVGTGRHIACAVISRFPILRDPGHEPKLLDKRRRILEVHLSAGNGKTLVVIASHWRSRLKQNGDDGSRSRAEYGKIIHKRYLELQKQVRPGAPPLDLLVCGDFNDNPKDVSVEQYLQATGDVSEVEASANPNKLFNLFAGKDLKRFGTHYYRTKGQSPWSIFDQIVVSAGMLDNQGWSCHPETAQSYQGLSRPGDKLGRPWSFGGRTDDPKTRGYSDHFPVTVTLTVH